jgi:hypothetical protein
MWEDQDEDGETKKNLTFKERILRLSIHYVHYDDEDDDELYNLRRR